MKSQNRIIVTLTCLALLALVAACTTDEVDTINVPELTPAEHPEPTAMQSPIIIDQVAETDRERVLVVPNFCLSFDPAIDSASGGREIYRLPLVREIHAGLTRVSSDDPPAVELDLGSNTPSLTTTPHTHSNSVKV